MGAELNACAATNVAAMSVPAITSLGAFSGATCVSNPFAENPVSSREIYSASSAAFNSCSLHPAECDLAVFTKPGSDEFALQPVRLEGMTIGTRHYASIDDVVRWGEPLRQFLTPFEGLHHIRIGCLGVAGLFCGMFSFPLMLGILVIAKDFHLSLQLSPLLNSPLQAMAGMTLLGFGPLVVLWTMGKISHALQEGFQKRPSRPGVALWLRQLEKKGQAYVSDLHAEIGDFRFELDKSSRMIDPMTRRTYDYGALLGPRSLRAFIRMASTHPRGVQLLQTIAKHNKKVDALVSDLEIHWDESLTHDVLEETLWIAGRGNRSVFSWTARMAGRDSSFIENLRELEKKHGSVGMDEIVSGIEVKWEDSELSAPRTEERIAWMISRGNRSVVRWLVDWAVGGDRYAEGMLERMEIWTSAGREGRKPRMRAASVHTPGQAKLRMRIPPSTTANVAEVETVEIPAGDDSRIGADKA
jgi:hypothetical protein